MRKQFLVGGIFLMLTGLGLMFVLSSRTGELLYSKIFYKKHTVAVSQSGQTNIPIQAVLTPLDLSQPVWFAVGGLGFSDNDQNQQIGDLVTAKLTGAPGFNLIERQSLKTILQELDLNLYGFVRAKDAVRVGKLLKVDWFLFGTEAKLNGTNSIVIRVVDAHTGIMRDAGIVPENKSSEKLASDIAAFVNQSRQNAANAKTTVYLAIGEFEDLSVNNRQGNFPNQLRGYLTAAYRGSSVTLLEREYVETLLQEVHLDMAGLTEESWSNSPPAMQSAYWLVSGQYQSYETTQFELELNLDVQRIFGRTKHIALRGQPGEPICQQAKQEIDAVLNQNQASLAPTRVSEIRAQMTIGKELANLEQFDLTYPNHYQQLDEQEAAKRRRNAEEAIKAFETVLLLDSANREARVFLAACLRKQTIGRVDEAREYYRELLEEPVQDQWTEQCQEALKIALMESGGTIDWLSAAMEKSTNRSALEFYSQQLKSAQTEAIIQSGEGPKAKELAEARLFEDIAANFNLMETGSGRGGGDFGMDDFVETFGTNRTAAGLRLAELYPKMKADFPKLALQLLEFVLTFQTGTNSPLLPKVEHSLDSQIAHPNEVYKSKYFKCESSLFEWSMEKKLYALAVKVMDRKRSVEASNNLDQLDDQAKIALGYAYQSVARWKDALDIFESYSNRPVVMYSDGPWGSGWTVVLTSERNNLCRNKLGLPAVRNPHEFDIGKPLLCLCSPSTFTADDNGLWVGIAGQLLKLDFDLRTNLTIHLPISAMTPIVTLCVSGTKVWAGTDGGGLIEIDKNSHEVRRFTVDDGLKMNRISSLYLAGDTLWIGYGYKAGFFGVDEQMAQNGGIGQMDVNSHRFVSFTPSIAARPDAEEVNADNLRPETPSDPTRRAVQSLIADATGTVWFTVISQPLRCYRKDQNLWEAIPSIHGRDFAMDGEHLFVGQAWNFLNSTQKEKAGPLGIHILNFKENRWHDFGAVDGLPSAAISAMTLHDGQLWVGGVGYVARVDAAREKVLNFSYVPGSSVDHIEVAGGYVWAQFDWHLYRAPLSALK